MLYLLDLSVTKKLHHLPNFLFFSSSHFVSHELSIYCAVMLFTSGISLTRYIIKASSVC